MDNSTSGCRPFYIAAPSYTFVQEMLTIFWEIVLFFSDLVHGIPTEYWAESATHLLRWCRPIALR